MPDRRRRPGRIEPQHAVGDEQAVEAIGDQVDADRGRDEPDRVDRLAAAQGDDPERERAQNRDAQPAELWQNASHDVGPPRVRFGAVTGFPKPPRSCPSDRDPGVLGGRLRASRRRSATSVCFIPPVLPRRDGRKRPSAVTGGAGCARVCSSIDDQDRRPPCSSCIIFRVRSRQATKMLCPAADRAALDLDLIHLGVIVVVNSVAPMPPLLAIMFGVLMLVTCPEIVMWLPRMSASRCRCDFGTCRRPMRPGDGRLLDRGTELSLVRAGVQNRPAGRIRELRRGSERARPGPGSARGTGRRCSRRTGSPG